MPWLPEQIPPRLEQQSVALPDLGDGEGAWVRTDALAVIEKLRGSTVAVYAVCLFEAAPVPGGYAPTEVAWKRERKTGEEDEEYARRTQMGAATFICECEPPESPSVFVLTFPVSRDAA